MYICVLSSKEAKNTTFQDETHSFLLVETTKLPFLVAKGEHIHWRSSGTQATRNNYRDEIVNLSANYGLLMKDTHVVVIISVIITLSNIVELGNASL